MMRFFTGFNLSSVSPCRNRRQCGQIAKPASFAIDTAASIDQTCSSSGDPSTGVVLDAVMSVGLAPGSKPSFVPSCSARHRETGTPRSRRCRQDIKSTGPPGLRVDAGLIRRRLAWPI